MKKIPLETQQEILAVMRLKKKLYGPAHRPLSAFLTKWAKSQFPLWKGLKFFEHSPTKGNYLIASYHHPAQPVWLWYLSINPFLKPYKGMRFYQKGHHSHTVFIPFILSMTFAEQFRDSYMLSSYGEQVLINACSEAIDIEVKQAKEQEKWA